MAISNYTFGYKTDFKLTFPIAVDSEGYIVTGNTMPVGAKLSTMSAPTQIEPDEGHEEDLLGGGMALLDFLGEAQQQSADEAFETLADTFGEEAVAGKIKHGATFTGSLDIEE